MPVSETNTHYFELERVIEAAAPYGGYVASKGAQLIGFSPAMTREEISRFVALQKADGSPCLRKNANSRDVCAGFITIVDKTVNEWYGRLSLEDHVKLAKACHEFAHRAGEILEHKTGEMRKGRNGKEVEKAKLSFATIVHGWAADGAPNLHVHMPVHRYVVADNGQTGSQNNRNKVFSAAKDMDLLFQLQLASFIEREFGIKADMVDGKVHLPAYANLPKEERLTGRRKEEALQWLAKHGWNHDPRLVAMAIKFTRKNHDQTQFTLEERVALWHAIAQVHRAKSDASSTQSETKPSFEQKTPTVPAPQRESVWSSVFKSVAREQLSAPAKVIATAIARGFGVKGPDKYKVNNVKDFLRHTKRRSILHGHRAAWRALLKTQVSGIQDALTVAEAAFKEGRRPKLQVREKSRVHLSKTAVEFATDKELKKLCDMAKAGRWNLTGYGLQERLKTIQEQEQKQKRGY